MSWVTSTRGAPGAPAEQRLDQAGRLGVEVGARLVEQQQLRLVEHGAADGQPLDHAGGEVADQLVRAARHPDPVEQLGDALGGLASEPVQAGVEAQVLGAGQVAVEQRLVAQVADPPARPPGLARQRAAEHRDLAGRRPKQRREHPQQRRLPGAVRAEHGQRLALAQLEGDVAEHRRSPNSRHRPAQRDHREGSGSAARLVGWASRSRPRARASATERYDCPRLAGERTTRTGSRRMRNRRQAAPCSRS